MVQPLAASCQGGGHSARLRRALVSIEMVNRRDGTARRHP
jgi:hypothetical protein